MSIDGWRSLWEEATLTLTMGPSKSLATIILLTKFCSQDELKKSTRGRVGHSVGQLFVGRGNRSRMSNHWLSWLTCRSPVTGFASSAGQKRAETTPITRICLKLSVLACRFRLLRSVRQTASSLAHSRPRYTASVFMTKKTPSGSNLAPSRGIKISPRYHVFSTFVVVLWGFLIIAMIIIHERGVRLTRDPSQPIEGGADHGFHVPWIYGPAPGLAGILRTAFTQAHGPITSMHLARLAVGVLEIPSMSPHTWMEVFWLADRRWAGPFGLGKTGWTVVSRRLRVSYGLVLLAALNVVALITPIVMSRAYFAGTRSAWPYSTFNLSTFDLSVASVESLAGDQLKYGLAWWSHGDAAPAAYSRNAYAGLGAQQNESHGAWFFTGDTEESGMTYTGIRVAGGCEIVQDTSGGPFNLQDMCQTEFGTDLNPPGKGKLTTANWPFVR